MCDWKKILVGGFAGAMVLPLVFFLLALILLPFFPYTPYDDIPGARSLAQPEALLSIVYPLLISFIGAFAYDFVRTLLPKKTLNHVLFFGGLLFLVETIPTLFLIYATFDFPAVFFLHQVLRGAIGYGVLGLLFFYVWKK